MVASNDPKPFLGGSALWILSQAYGEAKEAFFKRKAQQEASFPFG